MATTKKDEQAVEKAVAKVEETYEKGYHGHVAADRDDAGRPEDSASFAEHSKRSFS